MENKQQEDKIFNNSYNNFSIEVQNISLCELKVLQSSFFYDNNDDLENSFNSDIFEIVDEYVDSILKFYNLDDPNISQKNIVKYIKKNLDIFVPVISLSALKIYNKINNNFEIKYSEIKYSTIFALLIEYLGIKSDSLIKKMYDLLPNKIKELIIQENINIYKNLYHSNNVLF